MMQKMRRYIKAFQEEREGQEKSDPMKEDTPQLRPKHREGRRGRPVSGWQIIRNSALGLDMDKYEPEDDDIKFV